MLAFLFAAYHRIFKLFAKSFIPILPFNILYAFGDYLLNVFMPLAPVHLMFRAYASHFLISSILFTFFFIIILHGIYQQQHNQKVNKILMLSTGIKRFIPVFFSLVLIALPFIMMAFLLSFFSEIFEMLAPVEQHQVNALMIIMSVVLFLFFIGNIFWMGYCFYFYLATFDIVINKENTIQALKHSHQLIKNNWLKTFMLVFLLLFFSTLIQMFLFKFVEHTAFALISLFVLPLSASLMIVHYEQLNKKDKED